MLRAFKNWDLPKGLVDTGRRDRQRQREVAEETGLADLDCRSARNGTLPYGDRKKVARYYLCETGEHDVKLLISAELGRPEHQEFRWVSFDEAEELLPPRLAGVLGWARATITGN